MEKNDITQKEPLKKEKNFKNSLIDFLFYVVICINYVRFQFAQTKRFFNCFDFFFYYILMIVIKIFDDFILIKKQIYWYIREYP